MSKSTPSAPSPELDATSVAQATQIIASSVNHFVTALPVESQGTTNPKIGFGGFSMAVGIRAACSTVDTEAFKVYSVLGNFLGPALAKQVLHAVVTPIRDTRTFVTRRVELFQDQDQSQDGSSPQKTSSEAAKAGSSPSPAPTQRLVMALTVDFMRVEPRSLLTYSRPFRREWSGPDDGSITLEQAGAGLIKAGRITQQHIDHLMYTWRKALVKFDRRSAPEGWFGQTKIGLDVPPRGQAPMDDPGLLPTDKGTAEWYRPYESAHGYVDTLCSFAYVLDMGIASQVAQWNRIDFRDLAAVSSLEFAMRVFSNDLAWPNDCWLLREETPMHAGVGRTFNEAVMRRQPKSSGQAEASPHGDSEVLASMTQQCILRPSKTAKI